MYIVEQRQQIQLIKEMTQLRRDTENCEVYFHHTLNDQVWKSFFPRATKGELGPKLLRQDPLPDSLEDRIMMCLEEDVPENAIGLGIELSIDIEKWPHIMSVLEEKRRSLVASQIRLFIKHLQLNSYEENIRHLQIDKDKLELSEKDFKKLIWRARKLKMKLYLP